MKNNFRTFMLMAALTVLFVWAGGALGGRQGAFLAFLAAAGMNFFSYWFSDRAVLKRYRAAEVGPGDNSRLYRIVESLVREARMPMPRVLVIPQASPNAFATGRNPRHAAVAATQGILDILDDDELAGVMAHELTHVRNRDTLTSTVAATLAGAVAMMAQFARLGATGSRDRQNPLAALMVIIGAPLAAMSIRALISRVSPTAALLAVPESEPPEICACTSQVPPSSSVD